MPKIRVVALGAGQDVGRSCILVSLGGKNVMLDCGMHMGYSDERRFPNFSYVCDGDLTEYLDCVIITHFHLDHCGALPHMTEIVGYSGPIYMTYPTKAIVPVLLEDFRKIQADYRGETNFFTSTMIKTCMKKVTAVNLHEIIKVDDELSIQAFYAGHVLGAAMFLVKVGSESVLYTGDFNMTPDRHLGPARVPRGLCPDLLITETTYATTIRDSKRARERDLLKKVHDTVLMGGKVLIPVFALGRAQELCILLESYWERLDLKIPIYFSQGLTGKANEYYRLFINWTNEKIKKTFVQRNMFDFRHIKPFEQSLADAPGPMILFSTPGMLHGGQSLKVFKKWCENDQNMIVMPGYCAVGTIGAKVVNGAKKIEIDGRVYDIKIRVDYMSFSAHADAKGIMQLIRDVEPRNVMFVHGEDAKMEFLKGKVEKEFNIPVFKPANGETVTIQTRHDLVLEVPEEIILRSISNCPDPSKMDCPFQACLIMNKETKSFEVVSPGAAANYLGLELHTITLSEVFCVEESLNWHKMSTKLLQFDPGLQVKPDGIELFEGEILFMQVPNQSKQFELIWDESREHWVQLLTSIVLANKLPSPII